jgi:hypothetical protein
LRGVFTGEHLTRDKQIAGLAALARGFLMLRRKSATETLKKSAFPL